MGFAQPDPCFGLPVLPGEGEAVAALLLAQVHGHVRGHEQAVHVGAVLGVDAYADAGPHGARQRVGQGNLRGHCGQDLSRHGNGTVTAFEFVEDDHELVASHPGDGVGGPHGFHEPFGDGPQDRVARVVSVLVVDLLEAVQVHEEDAETLLAALGAGQGLGQAVEEEGPVGEPRQAVMVGQLVQMPLGLPASGDVVGRGVDQTVVACRGPFEITVGPVPVPEPGHEVGNGLA
ncbi:hypothetical protein DSECCO2_429490 [anaerobic digester metagenome]